jgi:hypothetical protein
MAEWRKFVQSGHPDWNLCGFAVNLMLPNAFKAIKVPEMASKQRFCA